MIIFCVRTLFLSHGEKLTHRNKRIEDDSGKRGKNLEQAITYPTSYY